MDLFFLCIVIVKRSCVTYTKIIDNTENLNIRELYRILEKGEHDIKAGNTTDAFGALEEIIR